MTALAVPARPVASTSVRESLGSARAHLVDSSEQVSELKRWLSTKKRVAIDTETGCPYRCTVKCKHGLDVDINTVRLVQIGDERDGWSIPIEFAGIMPAKEVIERFVAGHGVVDLFHATFDWNVLVRHGIKIPIHLIHDVMIMAHVHRSTGLIGLKDLMARHLDPNAKIAQRSLEDHFARTGDNFTTVDWRNPLYWGYGALDTVGTSRVRVILEPQVMAVAPASYSLEMQAIWPIDRMARKGVAVDRQYTEELLSAHQQDIDRLEKFCRDVWHVNPSSDAQVAEALTGAGIPLARRTTKTGQLSVAADVLDDIEHPLADAVLSRRKIAKRASTYLEAFLSESERDGRIHPNINPIGGSDKSAFNTGGTRGVRTGRSSCDHPNLQNVTVRTDEGKKVRNCLVPHCDSACGCGRPHKGITRDFDQIELRLGAHFSRDDELINSFRVAEQTGLDVFTVLGRQLYQDATMSKKDDRRQTLKNAMYAIQYMAGADRFARTANMWLPRGSEGYVPGMRQPDVARGQKFLDMLYRQYPGIRRRQRQVQQMWRENLDRTGEAFVTSPFTGRRFHSEREGKEWTLGNHMIQGPAGEILKKTIIEADNAGLGPYMVLPVHDEIDFDVPDYLVHDVNQVLDDVMNFPDMLCDDAGRPTVAITSSASVWDRWGEAK